MHACTQKNTDMTVMYANVIVTSRICVVGKGQQPDDGHPDNFLFFDYY